MVLVFLHCLILRDEALPRGNANADVRRRLLLCIRFLGILIYNRSYVAAE